MADPHLQREWSPTEYCVMCGGDFLPGEIAESVPRSQGGLPPYRHLACPTKKKRVYVSGPMTGMASYNFPAFDEAAERLRAEGYETVNPADKGIVDGWEWSDYLRYDIRQILDCDAIYMLDGWDGSKGAVLEWYVATNLGLEVLYE